MLSVKWDGTGHRPRVFDMQTNVDVPNVVAVTLQMDQSGVTVHMMVHPATVSQLPDALVQAETDRFKFYLPDPLTGQPRELKAIEWADGTRWDPHAAFATPTPSVVGRVQ